MENPAGTSVSVHSNLTLQTLSATTANYASAEEQDHVVNIVLGDGTTYSVTGAYLADGQSLISLPSYLLFSKPTVGVAVEAGFPDQVANLVSETTEISPVETASGSTAELNSLECKTCNVIFKTSRLYRKHVRTHDVKPFKCSKCPQSYNHEENYILHQAIHSNGPYQCPSCNKTFSRIASLKAHILIHQVEESVTCPDCEDEFNSMEDLDAHAKTHELYKNQSSKEIKQFPCQYCSMQFTSYALLRKHSKIHEKVKPFLVHKQRKSLANTKRRLTCDQCTLSFDKPNQLARHKRVHTGEKPFKCDTCGRAFAQKNSLQVHATTHTGNKPYSCPFCPYSTSQKGNLRSHIRCVHIFTGKSDAGYECEECNSTFRRPGSLSTHISRFHMNKLSQSSPRQSNDTNYPSAKGTLNSQSDSEKTAGPDILQKALENSGVGSVGNEEREVEDILPNPVPVEFVSTASSCTLKSVKISANKSQGVLSFTEKLLDGTSRKQRVKFVMEEDGKRYLCNFCTKLFKKPSDLLRHHRIHNNERPFKCPQCFRAFRLRSTLCSHVRAHEGIKIHKCTICDKKFSSSSSLSVHTRLHTGLKPYKCQSCQKTFRTKSHYNVHTRGHVRASQPQPIPNTESQPDTNQTPIIKPPLLNPVRITSEGAVPETKTLVIDTSERPHVCRECGAAYKKSNHLKQHTQSHTGSKPYSCPTCNKAYGSSSILKAHLLTHSNERNFECEICKQKFGTRTTLRRHLTIHSDERPYLCPYCQKAFKTNSQCKKHIRVHAAEVSRQSSLNAERSKGNPDAYHNPVTGPNSVFTPTTQPLMPGAVSVIQEPVTTQAQSLDNAIPSTTIVTVISDNNTTSNVHQPNCVLESQMGSVLVPLENLVLLPEDQPGPSNELESEVSEGGILYGQAMESNTFASFTLQGDHLEFSSLTQSTNLANILPESTILGGQVDRYDLTVVSAENESESSQEYTCQLCGKLFYDIAYFKYHMDCHVDPLNDNASKDQENQGKSNETDGILEGNSNEVDPELRHQAVVEASRAVSEKIFMDSLVAKSVSSSKEDKAAHSGSAKAINQVVPIEERDSAARNNCSFCGKFFRKASDLIRHVRVHTGEKPFTCSVCDKSFSLKSTLEHHVRTHLQSKSFACHICSKLFASRDTLKVHMRLHTGVKPFECPECKATFRTTGHRTSHMKTHLKGKNGQGTSKAIPDSDSTVILNVLSPQDASANQCEAQAGIIYVDSTGAIQITAFDTEVLGIDEGEILEEFRLEDAAVVEATAREESESEVQHSSEVMTSPSTDSSHNDNIGLVTMNMNIKSATDKSKHPSKAKLYVCGTCQASFKSEKAFQKHVCKPQHRPSYTCTVCQSSFPGKARFMHHIKLSHPCLNASQNLFFK